MKGIFGSDISDNNAPACALDMGFTNCSTHSSSNRRGGEQGSQSTRALVGQRLRTPASIQFHLHGRNPRDLPSTLTSSLLCSVSLWLTMLSPFLRVLASSPHRWWPPSVSPCWLPGAPSGSFSILGCLCSSVNRCLS